MRYREVLLSSKRDLYKHTRFLHLYLHPRICWRRFCLLYIRKYVFVIIFRYTFLLLLLSIVSHLCLTAFVERSIHPRNQKGDTSVSLIVQIYNYNLIFDWYYYYLNFSAITYSSPTLIYPKHRLFRPLEFLSNLDCPSKNYHFLIPT